VPFLVDRSRYLASRLPAARYHELPGMAHEPFLEDPGQLADVLLGAIAGP
jgi:pimeloyl-ACP methyl ester carboxylesterase